MCVYWQWSHHSDNAAQRRGAAGLDGLHQAMLMQGQFMRLPVGGAVLPEDVGQLQGWRRHGRSAGDLAFGLSLGLPEPVKRADGFGDGVGRDGRITRGGIDPAMAEQRLNDAQIRAVFQHVGGETVAEGVDGDAFVEARRARRFPAGGLQRLGVHVAAFAPSGEQPILRRGILPLSGRMPGTPPAAQHFQQAGGEHGIAVLLAFALPYADEHAPGIDVAHLQRHDLGDAQAGSIGGHQRGAIANGADVLEKLIYLGCAEHYRQLVRNPAARQCTLWPGRFQSHVVEELGGRHKVIDRFGRVPALIDQVELVFANFFQAQMFGAGLIESCQTGDVMQVGSLRFAAEIAQLHVFDHALTKRCHAMAPWIVDWSFLGIT